MSALHVFMRQIILTCLLLAIFPAGALAGALTVDGSALYAKHCAACHRQLKRTDVNDRPAKRIRSAINIFPSMSSLNSLSDAEVAAIAAALSTTPPAVSQR